MILSPIDWVIAAVILVICFLPALALGKRSGRSTSEFFASGRSVPWWLAGISMVATTFSSDTPNLVANFVRTQGVAGNWQWWAFTLTGVATVFFYARLWRRSGVLTDLEFYELRYSGTAASAVRGFRALYLGFFFNCIIMASVNLAACKIASVLFDLSRWQTLLAIGLLNVVFATHSGLWGVLVIDMIQFFVKMSAVIAAAYFAVELPQVGGLAGLVDKVSRLKGPGGLHYLSLLPDFTNNWDLAVAVFIMPLAVQWWAVWYPGAEPGGGSYIAQRMLASKTEKDALGGTLFFNVAHYVLRPWPWILVGLASLIVYPTLGDIRAAFPHVDPALVGHDIAFPAMLKFLPVGWIGLMVGGLIAANSSTILTHLNWGASYLVHDFYRRFLSTRRTERHYVQAGPLATVLLFVCSSSLVFVLQTAQDSFNIILQVGAGTGLLYLLRWFWWRVTAWCEIAAMLVSFGADDCKDAEALLNEVEARVAIEPRSAPEPEFATLADLSKALDWRLPEMCVLHALGADAVSRRIVSGGVLYPCQVIFFGPTTPIVRSPVRSPDVAGRFSELAGTHSFLIVEGCGVIVNSDMTQAERALLTGLAQIVQRIGASEKVRYLDDSELVRLLAADTEHYREVAGSYCA